MGTETSVEINAAGDTEEVEKENAPGKRKIIERMDWPWSMLCHQFTVDPADVWNKEVGAKRRGENS